MPVSDSPSVKIIGSMEAQLAFLWSEQLEFRSAMEEFVPIDGPGLLTREEILEWSEQLENAHLALERFMMGYQTGRLAPRYDENR